MNGLCVSVSEIRREECRSLIPCIFNGTPQCFSFGQLSDVTLDTFCLPSSETGGFVTGSTSVAVTFCYPQAASQPYPVLLELCMPGHSLSSAHSRGVQGSLVYLQLQNLAQTCQERKSWQCRAVWNMAPASTGDCFVFSENPTLCRGCDKTLPVSEEGQTHRLK